jgi:hypothetical protein
MSDIDQHPYCIGQCSFPVEHSYKHQGNLYLYFSSKSPKYLFLEDIQAPYVPNVNHHRPSLKPAQNDLEQDMVCSSQQETVCKSSLSNKKSTLWCFI